MWDDFKKDLKFYFSEKISSGVRSIFEIHLKEFKNSICIHAQRERKIYPHTRTQKVSVERVNWGKIELNFFWELHHNLFTMQIKHFIFNLPYTHAERENIYFIFYWTIISISDQCSNSLTMEHKKRLWNRYACEYK